MTQKGYKRTNAAVVWGAVIGLALARNERITPKWIEVECKVCYATAIRYIKQLDASPYVPARRRRESKGYGRAAFVLRWDPTKGLKP